MPDTLSLRVYAELNDHLPPCQRQQPQEIPCQPGMTLAGLLARSSIPQEEIDLVLVNGRSRDLSYTPEVDDRIALFPVFERLDITPITRLDNRPLRRTRFILDVHLGGLARKLRLLGFDTLYFTFCDDAELIAAANREQRLLLTRDRGIMLSTVLLRGYYVQAIRTDLQLAEVLNHFDLKRQFNPFSRCMMCNGLIHAIEKREIVDRISPATAACFDDYYQCDRCARIYWKGTHFKRMQSYIKRLEARLDALAHQP